MYLLFCLCLFLSHAISERITCTQLLPGNCRDNTCGVGSLRRKAQTSSPKGHVWSCGFRAAAPQSFTASSTLPGTEGESVPADEIWHRGQGKSRVWESCPGEQQLKPFQGPLTCPLSLAEGTALAHPGQCSTE